MQILIFHRLQFIRTCAFAYITSYKIFNVLFTPLYQTRFLSSKCTSCKYLLTILFHFACAFSYDDHQRHTIIISIHSNSGSLQPKKEMFINHHLHNPHPLTFPYSPPPSTYISFSNPIYSSLFLSKTNACNFSIFMIFIFRVFNVPLQPNDPTNDMLLYAACQKKIAVFSYKKTKPYQKK